MGLKTASSLCGFQKSLCGLWNYVQDAHNLTELVLSQRAAAWSHTHFLQHLSRAELDEVNGITEEAANPGFNYQVVKISAELMRALLITHEGERNYCGLSDDTRDCEVTAFIGSIIVCLVLLMLRNHIIDMKCLTGLQRQHELLSSAVPAINKAVNPNTKLWEGQSWCQIICHTTSICCLQYTLVIFKGRVCLYYMFFFLFSKNPINTRVPKPTINWF